MNSDGKVKIYKLYFCLFKTHLLGIPSYINSSLDNWFLFLFSSFLRVQIHNNRNLFLLLYFDYFEKCRGYDCIPFFYIIKVEREKDWRAVPIISYKKRSLIYVIQKIGIFLNNLKVFIFPEYVYLCDAI